MDLETENRFKRIEKSIEHLSIDVQRLVHVNKEIQENHIQMMNSMTLMIEGVNSLVKSVKLFVETRTNGY